MNVSGNSTTRSSDELISIHRDLNAFERGDYPKFKPEARWDFMLKLAGKCELYMKDKQAKGRDLSKPKHLCIQQLSADLTREVAHRHLAMLDELAQHHQAPHVAHRLQQVGHLARLLFKGLGMCSAIRQRIYEQRLQQRAVSKSADWQR